MNPQYFATSVALGAALLTTPIARAEITTFVNDFAGWQAAAGQFTTVDFIEEGPSSLVLFDHFAVSGVLLHRTGYFDPALPYWYRFTDEIPQSNLHDSGGLSAQDPHAFRFLAPIHAFAYLPQTSGAGDSMGLYMGGVLVDIVLDLAQPIGVFRGVYSTVAFDEVRFSAKRFLDDIYFSTIPAPGALAVLALAMPLVGRRRR